MSGRGRAAALAVALGATCLACGAAHRPEPSAETRPADAAASSAAPVTVVGWLEIVVGDPPPSAGAGTPRELYFLVDSAGRRHALLAEREQIEALGPAARRPGARVRVVGEPATTVRGESALRVIEIALAAPE